MSKDIVIIGAGGFGREVKWMIERINQSAQKAGTIKPWNIIGFVDDGIEQGTEICGIPVICKVDELAMVNDDIYAICAIGASKVRRKIIEQFKTSNVTFPNLFDPSAIYSPDLLLGKGNIICAGTILTVNIRLDDFVIINLDCTVGHDVYLSSFVTAYPSVNISGQVQIGECTEIGTGCQIIQDKQIGEETIIGAGAVVIRDIPNNCTAVGSPAKILKKN